MEQIVIVENPAVMQQVCMAMLAGYSLTVPGEVGTGGHGWVRKIERISPRTFHVTIHH